MQNYKLTMTFTHIGFRSYRFFIKLFIKFLQEKISEYDHLYRNEF